MAFGHIFYNFHRNEIIIKCVHFINGTHFSQDFLNSETVGLKLLQFLSIRHLLTVSEYTSMSVPIFTLRFSFKEDD